MAKSDTSRYWPLSLQIAESDQVCGGPPQTGIWCLVESSGGIAVLFPFRLL